MGQKALPILLMPVMLTACTVIPGMHMSPLSNQSSIEIPVRENNESILRKLNIKTITAQMIVNMEKEFNNRESGPNNAVNHYFDYRTGYKTSGKKLSPEKHHQYLVGPRDILTVTVWDHPELTIPAGEYRSAESAGNIVGEDGNMFYPYVGIIKAAGRTVEDIRAELTKKLAIYIEQVQMDVRVASYRSQRVYVVGEVNQPGIQVVKDVPLTVLEAINGAGGVNPERADLRNITLTRDGKTYNINLLALYEGGDVSQNVILKHGDVVNVADNSFNKVFVLGETGFAGTGAGRSRSIFMNKGRITLTEALSDSGGPAQNTADAARIFIFRSGVQKPEIFHLDAHSPDMLLLADRFPLQPHDLIYVDRAEGIRWNQIIEQIQPTITLLNAFDGSLKIQPFLGY
jgi:polysaccharide export outer membrane protein